MSCVFCLCVSLALCVTHARRALVCVCVAFLCVYRCARIELKAKVICQNQLRQQQIKILLALRIRSVRPLQRACVCLAVSLCVRVCVSVCIFIDCTLSTPRSRIRNALKCHKGKFGQLQRRHRTVAPPTRLVPPSNVCVQGRHSLLTKCHRQQPRNKPENKHK